MKKGVFLGFLIGILLLIGLLFDLKIALFLAATRITFLTSIILFFEGIKEYLQFFILFIIFTFLLIKNKKSKWIAPLFIVGIISWALTWVIKMIIQRPRPFISSQIAPLIEIAGFSFPSGHSMVVFSMLPILNRCFPKYKYLFLILSCLVALSRVYLGVHYFSDVVVGALIGYLIGQFAVKEYSKAGKNKS